MVLEKYARLENSPLIILKCHEHGKILLPKQKKKMCMNAYKLLTFLEP